MVASKQFSFAIVLIAILALIAIVGSIFIFYKYSRGPLIGGDKDPHGCLIGAGYSWNTTENACVREWENGSARYQNTGISESSCSASRGHWNECGSKCQIMNQGKKGAACTLMCEQLCECGGIAGFGCPRGYSCIMPSGIADALGYCELK